MLAADFVFLFTIAAMALSNFYLGPKITSDRIAMQWDTAGNPTWYAPKTLGLWGIVTFAILMRLLIWVFSTYAPDKVHGEQLGISIFSIVLLISHIFLIRKNSR